MSASNYKYDVAISFAEEDKVIAEEIAESCKKLELEPYFYEYENAENWGENIFNIIINRYKEASRFALILVSKHYVRKKWSDIERQIIQCVRKSDNQAYLLPVSLDDTTVPGLTDNILFMKWADNAEEIADAIRRKAAVISNKDNTEDSSSSTFTISVGRADQVVSAKKIENLSYRKGK